MPLVLLAPGGTKVTTLPGLVAARDDAQAAACGAGQRRVVLAAVERLGSGRPGRSGEALHVDEVQAPARRERAALHGFAPDGWSPVASRASARPNSASSGPRPPADRSRAMAAIWRSRS